MTPQTAACQASLSFPISWVSQFLSTELVMPSNHFILCCPLLFLPSIFPRIRPYSNEVALHIRWPKYGWFFRIYWFDLLVVQGTLKSLLQCHILKPSVLQSSAFFIVQLSHPYVTIGENITLTKWTFVGKMMSQLFNMPSRLVIAYFLPRSKHLLISWLQLPSAVILEPKKIKSVTIFTFTPLFAIKWWDRMLWS